MSIQGLELPQDVDLGNEDVLGGGGIPNSGTQVARIEMAYFSKSAKGASAVNLTFALTENNDRKFRDTIYISSGDKKGNKTFYVNKSGAKVALPGYTLVNQLALCANGKGIVHQDVDQKMVGIYDYETKKEEPTEVPVISSLLGQEVMLGIVRHRDNKVIKTDTGYKTTGEPRDSARLEKVFHTNGLSIAESLAGESEPAFVEKWREKYHADFVVDNFKAKETPAEEVTTEPMFG
jgi:hypothetical protein